MVVGYHVTKECIASSKGDICREPSYLDWLLDDSPGEEPKVFYDLDAAVAALARLIGIDKHEAEKLSRKKKLYMRPYRLTYFPNRFFSIDEGFGPGHPFVNFSNAGQYADTQFEADTSPEYAVGKAREAARVGEAVALAFTRLGLPATSLTSPISAFEKTYLGKLNLPTIDDLPEEAGGIAYETLRGNWLECWEIGAWEKAYDWDINAAYGEQLSKLLDVRRGSWVRSQETPDGAVYGFARGRITTWAEFHPFLVPHEEGVTITPVGSWETSLTLDEINFLRQYGLGEFEIDEGWWWLPRGQQYELLKGLVQWLWQRRQEAQGVDREIVKRILAGVWGKFSEIRGTEGEPEFGERFNPVFASVVENRTRLRVAATCLDCGVRPLQVAVDGIITDRPLPIETGDGLGQWRLSYEGRCIILGAGQVAFEDKEAHGEFGLRFSWLHDEMRQRPRVKEYTMTKLSPCSVARALATDFSKLGEVEEITRSVTVGPDDKRMWRSYPRCGGDVLKRTYQSAPWGHSIIAGEVEKAGSMGEAGGSGPNLRL